MMDITVKTLDGQNRSFSVPENITVKEFKEKIANSISISAETQRLIFQGKVLQDDKQLKDYDVHGKVVHVVVRAPPSANRPDGNDTPTPGPTPGMGGGNVSNIVVGSFTFPSDGVLDPRSVQRIAQDAVTAMGDMGRNARVSTSVSNDGSALDVHIHLGSQMESEAQMRLNNARRMIRLANETLDRLEHPDSSNGTTRTDRDRATGNQSTVNQTPGQPMETASREDVTAGQPMETADTETPSTSQSDPKKTETVQSEDVEMQSANGEPSSTTETANQEQPSTSQSEAGSSAQPSSTAQPTPRGPVRTNITALGEVLDEVEELNQRLQPHLQRFTQIVREDAQADGNELQQQQRVCNMVSEVMHHISHSYHTLSDLMVDLSQPRPRQLYVTLAQPHTAVIQQTIPVQAQVLVGGSPRLVRRQVRNQTPNQMTTDNASSRQTTTATTSVSSATHTTPAASTAATATTSTSQPSAPPPHAAGGVEGMIEAEIQAFLRRELGAAGVEGRGDGSPSNPYVFVEMGPDTISVNSISAQVVSSSEDDEPEERQAASNAATLPTSTATTTSQAQNPPPEFQQGFVPAPDFLQGFVESIMQSAGQATFGSGQGQPGPIRMMSQGPPGNIQVTGLPFRLPGLGRGFQVRPTVIGAGGPRNESATQTAAGTGIPTNSGTQTPSTQTNTSGTQTSQAPPVTSSSPSQPIPSSTSGTQTLPGPHHLSPLLAHLAPADRYLPCRSRHFLTQQARNMASQNMAREQNARAEDFENQFLSGFLGRVGNQPNISIASIVTSSGTSTSNTVIPPGSGLAGAANPTLPGMPPRANIRIGPPSGLLQGRMPVMPGMEIRMNIPSRVGIQVQARMPRHGPAPPPSQPGTSTAGATPTSQSGGTSAGGAEPQFVQMLRNMLQAGSQQSPTPTSRPTTSAATTTTTTTDQNQNIQPQPQPPISDEAFTRLVQGISSYMSQAAMGQAPRQSITEFLSNLGETYNIPQEEGFINDVLSCMLAHLQITDLIQVFYGSPGPLNQVREPLREFVRTRVLEGAAPTMDNIQDSVRRLVDSMQTEIQDTVDNCSPAQHIDFRATLNIFFVQHFNNIIRFLMNAEEATDTFGRDLYQCFRRFLSELVILCSRCLGGIQEVQRLLDHRICNMTGGVNPVIQQWMAGMTSQQLGQFIPTITVAEGEVSHYIINKASQVSAKAQEADCKVIERSDKGKKTAKKDTDKEQPSSSGERQHKRPASPQAVKAKVEPAQPMETSTPNSSPGASEMEIDSNSNRTATEPLPGALPAGAGALPVVRPKTGAEERLSPTGAQAVNGDWQAVVPPDWVPVITRDMETQKSQKSQQPHSDAYLQGMPPKRRRLMTQNRPGDISNSSEALSASLRRVVATAAVEPISSLDNMTNEVSDNTELQEAFQEEITSVVSQRLEKDTDYKPEKFPNTEDYYKKKSKGKTGDASGAGS